MGDGQDEATATLLIGAVDGPAGSVRVALARLDAALLARVRPGHVICPLFGRDGDAMNVAEALAALGWRGRLSIIAPGLPNRRMVQQEVQAAAPGIVVEVVSTL